MNHLDKGRKGVIAMRTRGVVLGLLATGMILGLSACMGFFDTGLQEAKLFVSDIIVTGAQGTVFIAVADMPGTGAASIAFGTVADPAIAITGIDETTVVVEGLGGFTELAWEFTATGGTLVAANAATGVVGGQIVKVTFAVKDPNPTFTISDTAKVKVHIGSDAGALIATTAWTLGTEAYYTK